MKTQRPSVKLVKAKSACLLVMRACTRGNSQLRQVLIFSIFVPNARGQEKHAKRIPNLLRKLAKRAIKLKELKKQNTETFFTPKSV